MRLELGRRGTNMVRLLDVLLRETQQSLTQHGVIRTLARLAIAPWYLPRDRQYMQNFVSGERKHELRSAVWSEHRGPISITHSNQGTLNRKATFEKYAPELSSAQISPVLRNILSNWLCYLIYFAISFFLSPFVVRRLGDSGYGIWTLTLSVTGYLGLLDLGVRGAVTRYVAKFHAQAADDQASRVVSSSLMIFLATGVIAIVSSGVLALSVVGVLNIPASYQPTAKIVVILTGINVAVSLVSGVFGGVVTALQRSDLSNGLQIIGTVFRSVAIVLVLSQGRGLVSLAVVHLVFGVLTGLAYWVLALRLYPGLKINFGRCDMESVKLIFWISAYSLPLQGATYLIFYTDSVVISSFLPISAVTFFAIAGNLVGYGRSLLSGISTISSPFT